VLLVVGQAVHTGCTTGCGGWTGVEAEQQATARAIAATRNRDHIWTPLRLTQWLSDGSDRVPVPPSGRPIELDLARFLTWRETPPIRLLSNRTVGVRMTGGSQRAMSPYASTDATTRQPARTRHRAVRVVGPVLALLLTVAGATAPARAATTAATAGATWSQAMNRKLDLDAESARLAAQLPGLRATVTSRSSELAQAQHTQAAAAATSADAATADQTARATYAAARTAAAHASSAVIAAQKRRPRDGSRIISAKRTRTTANATVRALSARVNQATSVLAAARTAYTAATNRAATATTASLTAARAVSAAQRKITSLPELDSALVAQAAAISQQVVSQTRAIFTITQTTRVYGITVNKIIAAPFQRMIDDAAKAGVPLSGGGFRTRQQQIALRTVNGCPDIWTAPSSSCKVPTAIPGRSLHEIGLAIDMTSGRKTISDRKSSAFKWLAGNAGRYGFVNLPSEPWHWSITGS
jgi:D-alanyl-D-alanine carboxypeptidase